ncbi:MAG: hypothetical protein IT162_11270 [Bryobacterales bacterium]|nr:hypothetical protein [Bryobacterales bacterium]
MMTRSVLLAVAALGGWWAAAPAARPDAGLSEFYRRYQQMKLSGLPDARSLQKLAPWLSAGLQQSIANARREQARCMKQFKDEKPPWIEGDLFSSNVEGFTAFRVSGGEAPAARLTVHFEYVENGQKFALRDDVEMVREGGVWKVNDIFFRQSAEPTATLRAGLAGPGCAR